MTQSVLNSTFRLIVQVPAELDLESESGESVRVDRETFYLWVWKSLGPRGLLGVHEGTLLSEEAAEQGLETESWTVDAGEAPRERDWVGKQSSVSTEFYFASLTQAQDASLIFKSIPGVQVDALEEQIPRDWDAEWKASFLNAGAGVEISPFWRIIPPWVEAQPGWIKINPGAGFGTGTHEATQLCLQAVGQYALHHLGRESSDSFPEAALNGVRALDFGSGSGILAFGLAKLGAQVQAVEIDPLAIENAIENAGLNHVQEQIHFSRAIPDPSPRYHVVVANILRPVLIEFAQTLVDQLLPGAELILSGLIDTDVEPIRAKFSPLFGGVTPRVEERGEWRAVIFKKLS